MSIFTRQLCICHEQNSSNCYCLLATLSFLDTVFVCIVLLLLLIHLLRLCDVHVYRYISHLNELSFNVPISQIYYCQLRVLFCVIMCSNAQNSLEEYFCAKISTYIVFMLSRFTIDYIGTCVTNSLFRHIHSLTHAHTREINIIY